MAGSTCRLSNRRIVRTFRPVRWANSSWVRSARSRQVRSRVPTVAGMFTLTPRRALEVLSVQRLIDIHDWRSSDTSWPHNGPRRCPLHVLVWCPPFGKSPARGRDLKRMRKGPGCEESCKPGAGGVEPVSSAPPLPPSPFRRRRWRRTTAMDGVRVSLARSAVLGKRLREVDDSETQGDEYYPYGVRHFYYSDPSHHNDYFNRASPYTFPFWDAASAVNNRDTDCSRAGVPERELPNGRERTRRLQITRAAYRYKDINPGVGRRELLGICASGADEDSDS